MQQQTYSDLPEGATVVSQPQATQAYSDLPEGAQLVHDPNDSGAFVRFAARALGVPEDVFHHPNKWLNPFSKEYNSPEHKAEQQQAFPAPTELHMPGSQTVQDIKSGNYAGAVGDVLPVAMAAAGAVAGMRGPRAPVEDPPSVYDGPMPPEIPAGKPQTPSTVVHVAKQVSPLLGREITGKIPILDRLGDTRVPTFSEYGEAFRSRPAAPAEQPVYGNVSNAEARGPYQPYQGDLTVAPESAGQNPVPQEVAPALEKSPGELTRLPSQSTLSGESALRQVLTGQDNANLMRIAKSRGINVTKEAQLKPGVADRLLVNKIIDDFSPDEMDEVGAKFTEASRFKHNFGDVGSEAWKSMSMQTYFPDVKLPAAMIKRVNAAIANAAQTTAPVSAVPPKAMAQAAAAGATMPQELAQPSISDALRASLAQRGIIVDANGNIIKK